MFHRKNFESESPTPEPIDDEEAREALSRREFIKRAGKAFIGAGLAGAGVSALYDKASQFARKLTGPEFHERMPRLLESMKSVFPHMDQWSDPERWAAAIESAFDDNDLPKTEENVALVLTLIAHESGFREVPRVYDYALTPSENQIHVMGLADPRTAGPMELTVGYVMEAEKIGYEEALKKLSTVEGGVFYGVGHLKKILAIYQEVEDRRLKLSCIFADYNAGEFASRNAGVQRILNEKMGVKLREDGLLLAKTREAIKQLIDQAGLSLSEEQIGSDAKRASSKKLQETSTWHAVEEINRGKIQPVPADRPVLGAYGVLKKALTGINNSREFAETRLREFQEIETLIAGTQ